MTDGYCWIGWDLSYTPDVTVTATDETDRVYIFENGDFYTITRKHAAIDEIKSQPFY